MAICNCVHRCFQVQQDVKPMMYTDTFPHSGPRKVSPPLRSSAEASVVLAGHRREQLSSFPAAAAAERGRREQGVDRDLRLKKRSKCCDLESRDRDRSEPAVNDQRCRSQRSIACVYCVMGCALRESLPALSSIPPSPPLRRRRLECCLSVWICHRVAATSVRAKLDSLPRPVSAKS